MTHVEILDAARDRADGYKVDVSRGQRIGRVSSEWFSRPADERYLSLSDLYAAVGGRTERSCTRTVESAAIRVEAGRDDAERLALMLPGSDAPMAPTHWSFGQLAGLVGALSAYLRQLPAPLAIRADLPSRRAGEDLEIEDGRVELRAVTGPDYRRIFDHELVAVVQIVVDWKNDFDPSDADIRGHAGQLEHKLRATDAPGRRTGLNDAGARALDRRPNKRQSLPN